MPRRSTGSAARPGKPGAPGRHRSAGAVATARTVLAIGALLAAVKIGTGLVGDSFALIADGVESILDVVGLLLVLGGLKIAAIPPDRDHPYGHGRAEPLAALLVALLVLASGAVIAVLSVHEIRTPHRAPAAYTLPVLLAVIAVKEGLFRWLDRAGRSLDSTLLRADAWHHRLDALTSAAAGAGIGVALVLGEGYESADDWAALAACGVIAFSGVRLARAAVGEIMDRAPEGALARRVRRAVLSTPGVLDVETCRMRKMGLGYVVDLHIEVAGALSVSRGHAIAHRVKNRLCRSPLKILDVQVHVEPRRRARHPGRAR